MTSEHGAVAWQETFEEFLSTRVYWPDMADAPQSDYDGPGYQYGGCLVILQNVDPKTGETYFWTPLNDAKCCGTLDECERALYEWHMESMR